MKTALRLKKIAEEINVDIKELLVVANKIADAARETVAAEAKTYGLELAAVIPFDPLITEYDTQGVPIVNLPADSLSVTAVTRLVEKLL